MQLTVLIAAVAAAAAQPMQHTCGDPSDGPVLGGVDVVGTFESLGASAPVMGNSTFVDESLGGYAFHFSTQANLDAFKANSSKYTPSYGGY